MNSRGYFGIGIYHPKYECNQGGLWRSAFAFGASFCFTIGPRFRRQASDTPHSHFHIPTYQYETLTDLLTHLPYGCPLVGVEITDRATPLEKYHHLERACYLLGAEDHGLPPCVIEQCHHLVQIGGLRTCLNVATTGSLVLYDRKMKQLFWMGHRKAQKVESYSSIPLAIIDNDTE